MPVKRRTIGGASTRPPDVLVRDLVAELKGTKEFGQPLVEVETFERTGLVGVTVVWDRLEPLSDAQRTAVILEAFTQAFGDPGPGGVAFALGLTVAEAVEAGKLPFALVASPRASDAISPERVRAVLDEFGGTSPAAGGLPALRFAGRDEAEACRAKLVEFLPGSDAIWTITQDVGRPDW